MRTPIWSLIASGAGVLLIALASVAAVFVSTKATELQRKKHPVLRKLDGKKVHLTLISGVLALTGAALTIIGFIGQNITLVRVGLGPGTGIASLATYDAFKRELSDQTNPQLADAARDYFRAATRDLDSGHYSQAATSYARSLDSAPTTAAYLNLALAFEYLSDFSQAESTLDKGINRIRSGEYKELEPEFLISFATLRQDQGRYGEALDYGRRALDLVGEGPGIRRANALSNMASILAAQGKLDEASQLQSQAANIYQKLHDELGQAQAASNLGRIAVFKGDATEGLKQQQEALDKYVRVGSVVGQILALSNIGVSYARKGRVADAREKYDEAVHKAQEAGCRMLEGYARNNLASLLTGSDPTHAISIADEAINIFGQIGAPDAKAAALTTKGNGILTIAVASSQDVQRQKALPALDLYKEALAISEQTGNRRQYATTAGNMAEAYRVSKDFPSARLYATRAAKAFPEVGDRRGQVNTEVNLGNIAVESGDLKEAEQHYGIAISLAEQNGYQVLLASAQEGLGETYFRARRYEECLQVSQKAAESFRSLNIKSAEGAALANVGLAYEKMHKVKEARDALSLAERLCMEASISGPPLPDIRSGLRRLGRQRVRN